MLQSKAGSAITREGPPHAAFVDLPTGMQPSSARVFLGIAYGRVKTDRTVLGVNGAGNGLSSSATRMSATAVIERQAGDTDAGALLSCNGEAVRVQEWSDDQPAATRT